MKERKEQSLFCQESLIYIRLQKTLNTTLFQYERTSVVDSSEDMRLNMFLQ